MYLNYPLNCISQINLTRQKLLSWGALADTSVRMPNNCFPEINVGKKNFDALGFTLQDIM